MFNTFGAEKAPPSGSPLSKVALNCVGFSQMLPDPSPSMSSLQGSSPENVCPPSPSWGSAGYGGLGGSIADLVEKFDALIGRVG
jgi:hypothetical protein